MNLPFPEFANLYDLLATAGRYFEQSQLKKIAIFFPEGKRCELEVIDGRTGRYRYQKIESPQHRHTEYFEPGQHQKAVDLCYDDASGFLALLQQAKHPLIVQTFVRFYSAAIETPAVYRYQTQGQKFRKTTA